jgi:hypothetical protein
MPQSRSQATIPAVLRAGQPACLYLLGSRGVSSDHLDSTCSSVSHTPSAIVLETPSPFTNGQESNLPRLLIRTCGIRIL